MQSERTTVFACTLHSHHGLSLSKIFIEMQQHYAEKAILAIQLGFRLILYADMVVNQTGSQWQS